MRDENIIVASLMKILEVKKITIPKYISDSINNGQVIVHKEIDNNEYTYKLEYEEGDENG